MKHLVLKGHEILALGFPQGKAIGVAIRVVSDRFTIEQREYAMNLLRAILKRPHSFVGHETYGDIVESLTKSNTNMKKQKVGQPAPVMEPTNVGNPMQA